MNLHDYLLGLAVILMTFEMLLAVLALKWRDSITPVHWELLGWIGILTIAASIASGLTK